MLIAAPTRPLDTPPFASFEWEVLDFRARNGKGVYSDAATIAASVALFVHIESKDTHYAPEGEPTRYYVDQLNGWFAVYRFSTAATFRVSDRTSVMEARHTRFHVN